MGHNTLKTLGSTVLSGAERSKNDYYGTNPISVITLLENEVFAPKVWEPCVGHHLMSNVLKEVGYDVRESDIAEYEGYEHEILDFLSFDGHWDGDIVTNPPYNLSTDIIVKALDVVNDGAKVAMFLRLQYLEGVTRYEKLFKDNPPKTVYVFSNRQNPDKNDDFSVGSAVAYCWYVWEKGYSGAPEIRWVRN